MNNQVHCPYCNARQGVREPQDYRPYYVNCAQCARRFIVEPVKSGLMVYRDGEAPCCSDPECREMEMADSGQE
ncbi:MAG: hypothetical protein H0S80_14045 [Desulfovibrionaceae bacterium]|nr:hypothetical protein [Desulfovibrionaceae bacterium]